MQVIPNHYPLFTLFDWTQNIYKPDFRRRTHTPEEAVVKHASGVGPPVDSSSQHTAPLTIYRLCIQLSSIFACMLICDFGYIFWERCANPFIQKVIHLLFMVNSYMVLYTIYLV